MRGVVRVPLIGATIRLRATRCPQRPCGTVASRFLVIAILSRPRCRLRTGRLLTTEVTLSDDELGLLRPGRARASEHPSCCSVVSVTNEHPDCACGSVVARYTHEPDVEAMSFSRAPSAGLA